MSTTHYWSRFSYVYCSVTHYDPHRKKKLLLLAISTHVNNFHHYNGASVCRLTPTHHLVTQTVAGAEKGRVAHPSSSHRNRLQPLSTTSVCIGVVWPRGLRNQVLLLILLPPLLLLHFTPHYHLLRSTPRRSRQRSRPCHKKIEKKYRHEPRAPTTKLSHTHSRQFALHRQQRQIRGN